MIVVTGFSGRFRRGTTKIWVYALNRYVCFRVKAKFGLTTEIGREAAIRNLKCGRWSKAASRRDNLRIKWKR